MLSGEVVTSRRQPSTAFDDARQAPSTSLVAHSGGKLRRRSKTVTRALPVGRHAGEGATPTPAHPPGCPHVGVREAAPLPGPDVAAPQAPFRFWVDEVLWSQGRVAVELLETVLAEAGGVRTGGPSRQEQRARRRRQQLDHSSAPAPGPSLGSQHMAAWELLWTKSTYAISAARSMRPGQVVSAIIGLNSLTMKKRLLLTLREVLGPQAAFDIMPHSFALPEELAAWEGWLRAQQQQQDGQRAAGLGGRGSGGEAGAATDGPEGRSCSNGRHHHYSISSSSPNSSSGSSNSSRDPRLGSLWILKTGEDAGKGLSLMPAEQALRYARQQQKQQQRYEAERGSSSSNGSSNRRFQLQVAQLYIEEPYLIHGRKFHLRLWVLVTAHCPLRAYLHRRGLVLFSGELYDKEAVATTAAAVATTMNPNTTSTARSDATDAAAPYQPPACHVTNYARNNNTLVWAVRQLAEHLGAQRFDEVWTAIRSACGRALAAAAPSLAEAHAWLRPVVQEYGFQILGVDFLLDEQLHPWLLEFNSAPSIMVQHEDDELRALVYEQKHGMLRDTWELVRRRVYRSGAGAEAEGRARRQGEGDVARWEATHAGEYEALMPYIR